MVLFRIGNTIWNNVTMQMIHVDISIDEVKTVNLLKHFLSPLKTKEKT